MEMDFQEFERKWWKEIGGSGKILVELRRIQVMQEQSLVYILDFIILFLTIVNYMEALSINLCIQ